MVFSENKRKRNYNFLLVYREVKEILLDHACFLAKLDEGLFF